MSLFGNLALLLLIGLCVGSTSATLCNSTNLVDKCYVASDDGTTYDSCVGAGCDFQCCTSNNKHPSCINRSPSLCNVIPRYQCSDAQNIDSCQSFSGCVWCPRESAPSCIDGCVDNVNAINAAESLIGFSGVIDKDLCKNISGKYCPAVSPGVPVCQFRHVDCLVAIRDPVTVNNVATVSECENSPGLWCPPHSNSNESPCIKPQPARRECFLSNNPPLPFTSKLHCQQNRGVWCGNKATDKCIEIPDMNCYNCSCPTRFSCLPGNSTQAECLAEGCTWCTDGASPQCIFAYSPQPECSRVIRIPCSENVDYNAQDCSNRGCNFCPLLDRNATSCIKRPYNPICYENGSLPCNAVNQTNTTEAECHLNNCIWCGDITGPKCIEMPAASVSCDSCDCTNLTDCHYESEPTPNSCYQKGCAWCDKCDGVTRPKCAIINNQGVTGLMHLSPCSLSCGGGIQFKMADDCNDPTKLLRCRKTYSACNTLSCPNETCSAGTQLLRYGSFDSCCNLDVTSTCGKNPPINRRRRKRVVDGTAITSSFHWPWIGIFHPTPDKICGAVLFNNSHAFTSALCVKNVTLADMRVKFGTYSLTSTASQVTVRLTSALIPVLHDPLIGDIAMLEFESTLVLSNNIAPICLPEAENPLPSSRCYIAGWGRNSEDPLSCTTDLHEASVQILPYEMCETAYSELGFKMSREKMLCIGNMESDKDACFGDQGGAVMCQRRNSCDWYVAGIISQGVGCGTNRPTVATKVSAYEYMASST